MPRPHAEPLTLSPEERAALREWAAAQQRASSLALRARIVLRCADGETISQVAASLGISRDTVSKWRRRFATQRLDGLSDDPRPGRPRLITDEQIAQVIMKTLDHERAVGDGPWSTRSLAAATGLSQSAISRIWRSYDRPPYTTRTWTLSTQPGLTDLVCDVAGVFVDPPHDMLALCALRDDLVATSRYRMPRGLRIGPDLVRCATKGLISALAHDDRPRGAAAQHTAASRDTATGRQCRRFLAAVDRSLPVHLTLHLVCADASTYRLPEVKNWLLRHPRSQLYVTPTSSSWFAVVERWLAEFTSRMPYPVTPRDMVDLELAVREWLATLTHQDSSARPSCAFQQVSPEDQIRRTLDMQLRWLGVTAG